MVRYLAVTVGSLSLSLLTAIFQVLALNFLNLTRQAHSCADRHFLLHILLKNPCWFFGCGELQEPKK